MLELKANPKFALMLEKHLISTRYEELRARGVKFEEAIASTLARLKLAPGEWVELGADHEKPTTGRKPAAAQQACPVKWQPHQRPTRLSRQHRTIRNLDNRARLISRCCDSQAAVPMDGQPGDVHPSSGCFSDCLSPQKPELHFSKTKPISPSPRHTTRHFRAVPSAVVTSENTSGYQRGELTLILAPVAETSLITQSMLDEPNRI